MIFQTKIIKMSTYFINQQIILQNNITKTYFLGQHSNNNKVKTSVISRTKESNNSINVSHYSYAKHGKRKSELKLTKTNLYGVNKFKWAKLNKLLFFFYVFIFFFV